jgi:PTS system mannose-specific IIC component
MTIITIVLLVTWGTFVAVDLVSAPQGLFSRPLVAATVAGAIAGDVTAGLVAGAVLELYALEIMPIGASRYPDYGPAAVAGGAAAATIPAAMSLGIAGLVGLPLAMIGGWSMLGHRRRNARSIRAGIERINAGDGRAIWELQRSGLLGDATRGILLSLLGLVAIWGVSLVPWESIAHQQLLGGAVLAGGIAAALGGAARNAGHGVRRHWLAAGLILGCLVALA